MPTVDEVSVHVRAAHRAEVDSIVAFARAVVPPHYAPILGNDAANEQLKWWTADRIGSAVAAGRVHVAVADDAIVGVAETGALGDEQVIWKLYLAPDFRGRGLGRELLAHAVAALPVGTAEVQVEHFAGNDRAGGFYERVGFVVDKTVSARSGEHRADIVWRRLRIEPAPGSERA